MKSSTDRIGEVRSIHPPQPAPEPLHLADASPTAAAPHTRDLPTSVRYSVKADDGKIYGPFTADMMLGWLADGRIALDTPTHPLGRKDWQPLATFLAKPHPVPEPRRPASAPEAQHQERGRPVRSSSEPEQVP